MILISPEQLARHLIDAATLALRGADAKSAAEGAMYIDGDTGAPVYAADVTAFVQVLPETPPTGFADD